MKPQKRIPITLLIPNDIPMMEPLDMMYQLGLTQNELAIALGCSLSTVKSWVGGNRQPSIGLKILTSVRYSQISSEIEQVGYTL